MKLNAKLQRSMAQPLLPVKISVGDKIKDQFLVKKKIGEGACGQVFLVDLVDKGGKGRAAMKIEPLMKCKDDEILKMEIFVLKKLQNSRHVCRLLGSGKTDTFTFVVMSLLGKEVADVRRRLPGRKISAPSTIRIFIQITKGLQDMHEAGFVHRDVKPSNMALGLRNEQVVYIFDFGLARQIMTAEGGKMKLREPRTKVSELVSRNMIDRVNAGHAEIYRFYAAQDWLGALFSMIECVTATLPWKGMTRKDAGKVKEKTSDAILCKGCPKSFLEIATTLRKLKYQDTPPYKTLMEKLKDDLPPKLKMTDPFEWNTGKLAERDNENDKSDRDHPERGEKSVDQSTVNEVDESVVTEDRNTNESTKDAEDYDKENTLEGV